MIVNNYITFDIRILKYKLLEFLKKLERKKDWIAPLGILITIVLTFVVSDFKDKFGLTSEQWRFIAYLSLVITFVWLLNTVFIAIKSVTIDDFIQELENSSSCVDDCRVLFFFKNKDENGIWRTLVYYCPVYKCYMLPYKRKNGDVLLSNNLKIEISQKLMMDKHSVSLEHLNGLSIRSIKYSSFIKSDDRFFFEFYFVHTCDKKTEHLNLLDFETNGGRYSWKTVDELMNDSDCLRVNGDVLIHMRDNFNHFFSDDFSPSFPFNVKAGVSVSP